MAAATLAGGCSLGGDSDRAGGERRPDPVVLTLANHEDSTLDLQEFALAVQRLSQGSLRIEFKNRWRESEVDYEPRTIEDVRDGKTDLAKVSARAFDVVGVNSLQPLVAPFAVDSYALQREVLLGGMTPRMLAGVERLDLVGIALLPGELRRPLGASRPLVGPGLPRADHRHRACRELARARSARSALPARPSCRAPTRRPSTGRNLGSTDFRAITTTVPRVRSPPT